MSSLAAIGKLPEVKRAVVSDSGGALLESVGEPDPEGVAAVMGFCAAALGRAGELLGFGSVDRFVVTGVQTASISTMQGDTIVTVFVDPTKPISVVEKKLETALPR
jgi:hypothetical protein